MDNVLFWSVSGNKIHLPNISLFLMLFKILMDIQKQPLQSTPGMCEIAKNPLSGSSE